MAGRAQLRLCEKMNIAAVVRNFLENSGKELAENDAEAARAQLRGYSEGNCYYDALAAIRKEIYWTHIDDYFPTTPDYSKPGTENDAISLSMLDGFLGTENGRGFVKAVLGYLLNNDQGTGSSFVTNYALEYISQKEIRFMVPEMASLVRRDAAARKNVLSSLSCGYKALNILEGMNTADSRKALDGLRRADGSYRFEVRAA